MTFLPPRLRAPHRELVRALCELHRIGVIHRDIKSENAVFASRSCSTPDSITLPGLKVCAVDGVTGRNRQSGLTVGVQPYSDPMHTLAPSQQWGEMHLL